MDFTENYQYALNIQKNLKPFNGLEFVNFSNQEMAQIAYLDCFEELSSNIDYLKWCDEIFKRIQNQDLTNIKPLTEKEAFQMNLCLMKYNFDQYKIIAKKNECYDFLGAPMNEPKHLWELLHSSSPN